ncbi:hypothetical protein ACFGVS_00680 [Mucilaginibacter sp. AW1-7]|uniref:hypothetical protein n=1 Tax=Mucilaginibacter sp. AW1-7 TaxID=3349874 RepID=UPI003F740132
MMKRGAGKLKVTAVIELQKPINELISSNLYRIIQEFSTNTLKHAMARQARIELSLIDNEIPVIYEDNGKDLTPITTTCPAWA